MLNTDCRLQFVLAPKPSTAFFLRPEERAWLANRQTTLDDRQNAKHPRQGKWWACIPGGLALQDLCAMFAAM